MSLADRLESVDPAGVLFPVCAILISIQKINVLCGSP